MSATLYDRWQALAPRPGGARIFSWLVGRMARYTGSIRPRVRHLEPGRCEVAMADRRAVRNHLGSVHAIALMNLGEVVSGLAVLAALGPDRRGIVTDLAMRYEKKARGPLVGRADFEPPAADHDGAFVATAELFDDAGDRVAVCTATWTLGPRR